MENNKQLGPVNQMETHSDSAVASSLHAYNNGSEDAVLKFTRSQLDFRSNRLFLFGFFFKS